MTNATGCITLQFDVEMEPGVLILKATSNHSSHSVSFNMIDDTHARVMIYSLQNRPFSSDAIMTIDFGSFYELSNSKVKIYEALAVNTQRQEELVPDITYTMDCQVTGLDVVTPDDADAVYYDLQGIRVEEPQQGNVYIKVVNGVASKVVYQVK
ncbi:MAG: hypothetical protein J6R27_00605 [Muribaculaceae bacterium]|nr:hypothetical protein [Muribaculaceae bacterium]